ncbi:DUF7064 domain-containing protein [Pseudonocardia halophobica]|uniref:DUF7064 domain-containing protein n=1 Tax=Pseudonocardia halophobica TaxID=29401 RepID=UPI003D8ED1D5
MISAEHYGFQHTADADHTWLESLQFPVVVPEAHLYALCYINVRPTLGVMWNQVMVCGTLTESRSDLLHYNENHFLPAPADFLAIDSPLGLRIRALDAPREFRIDYAHPDGTEIHVDWTGLMDPFDIHDPAQSPQAGIADDLHSDVRGGTGHVDMTGRVTGTLTVRGRTHEVYSLDRMDRSWGPRHPMKTRNMFIVSVAAEPDLAFHMICPWEPDLAGTDAIRLMHGFVYDGGEVRGLVEKARIEARHHGMLCTGLDMEVHDVHGRRYDLHAVPDIGAPWIAGPSAMTHNALMRFTVDGRPGYGRVLKNYSLPYLNARRGRFHDEPTAAVYV